MERAASALSNLRIRVAEAERKRGQESKAGTALRVFCTFDS